jgi:hypothetical protein
MKGGKKKKRKKKGKKKKERKKRKEKKNPHPAKFTLNAPETKNEKGRDGVEGDLSQFETTTRQKEGIRKDKRTEKIWTLKEFENTDDHNKQGRIEIGRTKKGRKKNKKKKKKKKKTGGEKKTPRTKDTAEQHQHDQKQQRNIYSLRRRLLAGTGWTFLSYKNGGGKKKKEGKGAKVKRDVLNMRDG